MSDQGEFSPSCPIPKSEYDSVLLAHGGGGTLMQKLIHSVFLPAFSNPQLNEQHDAAVFDFDGTRIAFTTDSYVIQPIYFPGGDIGSLAVHGTVNDLAMSGARPVALSVGMILEEGFPMRDLETVTQSMQQAAQEANVVIATGDTKVVDHGKGDGIYINTSGIGVVESDLTVSPKNVKMGDAILLNGDIGRHGMAIMAVREGLEFESQIETDSAPLADLVMQLLQAGIRVHCMRDCTRGGVAAALNEIAEARGVTLLLDEINIPVRDDVQGACEILGFDPLYVANEGRFVAFVAENEKEKALEIMRNHPQGKEARQIGMVEKESSPLVAMKSALGATRIIDQISGEQLPRIC
ncbi:hydrogenase expression/formation protein HypE [bacterium]|nr:hydrogenase expression/formation protein HypE [bacterium]